MNKILLYIVLIFITLSCEEAIDWDQQGEFTPRLVVDAMLTNKADYNYVKLSLPVSTSGEIPSPVSGAEVSFTINGVDFVIMEEDVSSPGYYLPVEDVRGVVNKLYTLNISIAEYEFSARASMVPVVPLQDFSFYEDPLEAGYYRINFPGSNVASMIRYIAEYNDPDTNELIETIFYHYNLSTVDVNQFFKPVKEILSFPANTTIIRNKYSLSPDHEKYIRSLLSETEWKGGWFDLMPGNLHTNLSTGGVGYFGASSLLVDTVYFE